MYACHYVYMHAYVNVHNCRNIYVYVNVEGAWTRRCIDIYIRIYTSIYIQKYVSIHMNIHVCHVHMYTNINAKMSDLYVYRYVYMCMYIRIYTNTCAKMSDIRVCLYVRIYTQRYIRIYIPILATYMCIYASTCVCIYIYAHMYNVYMHTYVLPLKATRNTN